MEWIKNKVVVMSNQAIIVVVAIFLVMSNVREMYMAHSRAMVECYKTAAVNHNMLCK